MNAAVPDFSGDLMIFVDGYGQDDWRCWEHNEPDDYFWIDHGWAVGANERGRYCSRRAVGKIRKYRNFDDAVRYIEARRKKRPKERFFLVYVVGDRWDRVSTMDEILALDAAAGRMQGKAPVPSELMLRIARLRELGHSWALASRMSHYLLTLQEEGEEAASAGLSRSTLLRYRRLLREAGFIQGE